MSTKNNLTIGTESAPLTTDQPEAKAGSAGDAVKALFRWEARGVLIALIILCAILAIASPNFLTPFNLTVVIREASFVGLVALGQTLVLLLGGIDLSVGAAAGLSAIVGCLFLKGLGIPPWLVIPATAVFGLCIGSISGFFISVLKLNPFIVTLAMWEIFAGMTLVITKGYPIRPLGPAFTVYGQGQVFGIPGPVMLFLIAAAILIWVLSRTRFGRNLYAIGRKPGCGCSGRNTSGSG
jgi:ribose transport system permease protein